MFIIFPDVIFILLLQHFLFANVLHLVCAVDPLSSIKPIQNVLTFSLLAANFCTVHTVFDVCGTSLWIHV